MTEKTIARYLLEIPRLAQERAELQEGQPITWRDVDPLTVRFTSKDGRLVEVTESPAEDGRASAWLGGADTNSPSIRCQHCFDPVPFRFAHYSADEMWVCPSLDAPEYQSSLTVIWGEVSSAPLG